MMPAPNADSSKLSDNKAESASDKYMYTAPDINTVKIPENKSTSSASSAFQMYDAVNISKPRFKQHNKSKTFAKLFCSDRTLSGNFSFSSGDILYSSLLASDFLSTKLGGASAKKRKSKPSKIFHFKSTDIYRIADYRTPIEEDSSQNTTVCTECGNRAPDIFSFCPVCGASFSKPKQTVTLNSDETLCPHCSCAVPKNFDFCINCGTKLI